MEMAFTEIHKDILPNFDIFQVNGDFVDCTLVAEGKSLDAHRVILSACSIYFKEILLHNAKFNQHPIIILPNDVKYKDLISVLDYIYQRTVRLEDDSNDEDFVILAEQLKVFGFYEEPKSAKNIINQPEYVPKNIEYNLEESLESFEYEINNSSEIPITEDIEVEECPDQLEEPPQKIFKLLNSQINDTDYLIESNPNNFINIENVEVLKPPEPEPSKNIVRYTILKKNLDKSTNVPKNSTVDISHSKNTLSTSSPSPSVSNTGNKFICDCGKSYKYNFNLNRHKNFECKIQKKAEVKLKNPKNSQKFSTVNYTFH